MDANMLKEIILGAGYEPRSYSGRGMYGEYCVGFTTEGSVMYAIGDLLAEIAYVNGAETEKVLSEFAGVMRKAQTDSMGLGTIIYFPRVKWEED